MDLILWRHAEAHDAEDDLSDKERRLTTRGEKQANRMSEWLDRNLTDSTRIYCSPTKRSIQTVETLGRKYKVRDELGPMSHWEAALALANWPHAKHPALLIGHQPMLGTIAAHLLRINSGECAIAKGSVWWFRTRGDQNDLSSRLSSVQSPDLM
jgi:phosphohistidine phosphatase